MAIQIGWDPSIEDELRDACKEYKIKFKRTNKPDPVRPYVQFEQYIVYWPKNNVLRFLKELDFEKEYYTDPRYVVTI